MVNDDHLGNRGSRIGARGLVLLLVFLVGLIVSSAPTYAASELSIRQLVTDGYPQVGINLILEAQGEPEFLVQQDEEDVVVDIDKLGEQPMAIVMLIDLSGSMRGEPIVQAKKAAKQFVERAGADDKIAIVSFSSEVVVANTFTNDKDVLSKAIENLEVKGETRLHDALIAGYELIETEELSRKAIIVLSDGGDTRSNNSGEELLAVSGKKDTPVFSIALFSPELDTSVLEQVSSGSGGRLITDVRPESLGEVYDRLATEFRSEYLLTFESNVHSGPSTIEVTALVGDEELKAKVELVLSEDMLAGLPSVEPVSKEGLFPTIASPVWLLVAAILGFSAVALFVSAIGWKPPRNVLAETMKYYEELRANEGPKADGGSREGLYRRLVGITGQVAEKRGFTEVLSVRLQHAGLPVKPHEYMIAHLAIVIFSSLLALAGSGSVFVSIVVIGLAVVLPVVVVNFMAGRRIKKLNDQLPDVLSGISGFLKAGYGVSQAIESSSQDAPEPIGAELRRVAGHISFGTPVEEALGEMAERVGSKQFDWAVIAISINRETGGNLADILDKVAAGMRQRQAFSRQVVALSAEGRLSATILLVLPFVLAALLFFANPEYMSLLVTTDMGRLMLGMAAVMMVIGTIWMRRVARIDY